MDYICFAGRISFLSNLGVTPERIRWKTEWANLHKLGKMWIVICIRKGSLWLFMIYWCHLENLAMNQTFVGTIFPRLFPQTLRVCWEIFPFPPAAWSRVKDLFIMIGLFYSTEENSYSLRRTRWYIGNTLIAVLHLRQMLPQSAMSNGHVNMAAGYQGKEMVRLEVHVIFLFSVYVISFRTIFYEVLFVSLWVT